MRQIAAGIVAVLLALSACAAPAPVPIAVGADACDHCHMPVADPRLTAELLTTTGRLYRFDDIGCLAGFLADGVVAPEKVHGAWAADFLHAGLWLPVESAIYLRTDSLHTPMASGLIALAPGAPVDSVVLALGGTRLDWAAVRADAQHPREP